MNSPLSESPADLPVVPRLLPSLMEPLEEESFDWELVQSQALEDATCRQLVYRQQVNDQEVVQACLSVAYAADQTVAVVHLPLNPPLKTPLHVEAGLLGDVAARVRVTEQQAYGVRLEVTLGQAPAQPADHRLQLTVTAQCQE